MPTPRRPHPATVGVTGHRRLDATPAVLSAVDEALAIADSAGSGLVLHSALAEGADRLVADRALRRPGASLVAVLPLAQPEYETDFDPGSQSAFRRLLARATSVTVTGAGPDGSRESAYERAGRAVVDACDMLIALWDGMPSRGRGGTAEVVEYARSRGVDVVVIPVRRPSEGAT